MSFPLQWPLIPSFSSVSLAFTCPFLCGNNEVADYCFEFGKLAKITINNPHMIPGASEMPPQVPGKSRQVMAQKILQQSREAESALADALVSLPPGGVLVSASELHLVEFNTKTW